MNIRLIFIILFLGSTVLQAQEVRISKDLDIRNYFSYDLVGDVNDRIILFRDKGFDKEIDVFDLQMNHKFEADLILEDRKAEVMRLIDLDTCFQILYSYIDKDTVKYMSKKFDEKMQLQDSLTIFSINREDLKRKYKLAVSDDHATLMYFTSDKEGALDIVMVRNDSTSFLWNNRFVVEDIDVNNNFKEVRLSNDGRGFFYFEKNNNRFKKEEHFSALLVVQSSSAFVSKIDFEGKISQNVEMGFDNLNDRIVLSGFYNEKEDNKAEGIFILNTKINELKPESELKFIVFNEELLNEINTSNKNKTKYLENFDVNNLVLRKDGGLILFAEKNKVFSRRNPYNTSSFQSNDNFSRRGWTDYYNEDVIAFAFSKEKALLWTSVLYKKQFSQDDDGIYSSYFLFKTPSRLKMLYNDEIKKNNTVSEYIIDPIGNNIRNSILSTDYQNLKLRFTGAVQISSNSLIVPSESSYTLNIVKIEY